MSISQLFTIFFSIFLKPHARKKQDGISFLVLVPLLFCIKPMPPHIHLIQDLDPIVIPKDYIGEGRP